jgi:hypothetical protein
LQVKDFTIPEKEYKGRWTEARDESCPCRSWFSAHDCGHYRNVADNKVEWVVNMQCATRWNSGCEECLKEEPVHVANKRGNRCKRCKKYLVKELK